MRTRENCTLLFSGQARTRCCQGTLLPPLPPGTAAEVEDPPEPQGKCSQQLSAVAPPGHFHIHKASGNSLSPGLEESGKSAHCGFQKILPEV